MSTIGPLLAMAADPGIKPWDEIVQSSTQTKTGLMTLAELKAKQQAEQAVFEQHQERSRGGAATLWRRLARCSARSSSPRPRRALAP